MNTIILRTNKPNSGALTIEQYCKNKGIGGWSYDLKKHKHLTKIVLCNWKQTKMIQADIESFTEMTDPKTFLKKYYINFKNTSVHYYCDHKFNSQTSRIYKTI